MVELPKDRKDLLPLQSVAARLKEGKGKVLESWEIRARQEVLAAQKQNSLVLQNMVPELLDNLMSHLLSDSNATDIKRAGAIGKEHGSQRANLVDYTISQVLYEYRILRQVVFEVIEKDFSISTADRNTILDAVDEGLESAVTKFMQDRSSELQRSNRELENFAEVAAHDLKGPVATIASFMVLLEDALRGKVDLEDLDIIKKIKLSAANVCLLIDCLLDYACIGRTLAPFAPVSTDEVIKGVMDSMKEVVEKNKAEIVFRDAPVVMGERTLLTSLFQNLISNALKFHSAQRTPRIQIETQDRGRQWLFSVKDNGIGFDPKQANNIFSLFKRLHDQEKYKGSGIGLATARKVVELHGGEIWANSTPGAGSVFFFTLPKVRAGI